MSLHLEVKHAEDERSWARTWLTAGVTVAAVGEACASTALSLGRVDLIGDLHASPDQFAWLDLNYTIAKLLAFFVAPWLVARFPIQTCVQWSVTAVAILCSASLFTDSLGAHLVLRALTGACGGALLVAGQAMLFQAYPRAKQVVPQGFFAVGAVVMPATLLPALQGWLTDRFTWTWIYASAAGLCALALVLLLQVKLPPTTGGSSP